MSDWQGWALAALWMLSFVMVAGGFTPVTGLIRWGRSRR